ncbi:hypothetical protein GCM10009069_28500 [Algimonas arctica]|uniref:Glycosyl hydrolase family 13 catalytic domain-containing protein n=1 Tax=Algimonas arctica TaxID=1479486 RepID=A0A8J3CTB5_9PROT|nr:alpha-amylase family glycosyl hydrolase [Algimonas arctica]GHB04250.1 hypothetical protein GCM10009069_28500 [Algimonas arctica]
MKFQPFTLIATALLAACTAATTPTAAPGGLTSAPYVKLQHPDWSRDAVIYEINVRQYSDAGTFDAVREDLPRLKELGVDILWLMPIHPIGELNRKGTLGSYYSVKDYYGINPEFGTKADFKRFVETAHAQGFKVILDWVANHTAWDNDLAINHPDWYEKDWKGDFRPTPWWDWSDIIDLDFSNPDVRAYMSDAMTYWVEEMNIDGFRADVAGYVPLEFWDGLRARLDAIKPVFMLAEWQTRDLHAHAFDATYAWEWKEALQNIAQGKADTSALYGYYSANESAWPKDAMRMTYTDNHDQNSWDGLPPDIYGDAYEAAIVLQFTGEGIPLIYSGQECANPNRLEFFEKDPIIWNCDAPLNALFKDLVQLKTDNPVLHNGAWGATTTKVENSNPHKVFSFIRQNEDGNAVLVVANVSDAAQTFRFTDPLPSGTYRVFRTDTAITIGMERMTLPAWGWSVYHRDE